jgi:hypothetical protein
LAEVAAVQVVATRVVQAVQVEAAHTLVQAAQEHQDRVMLVLTVMLFSLQLVAVAEVLEAQEKPAIQPQDAVVTAVMEQLLILFGLPLLLQVLVVIFLQVVAVMGKIALELLHQEAVLEEQEVVRQEVQEQQIQAAAVAA